MWTKAKATIKGALPNPATQWTAILFGPSLSFPFSLNSFLAGSCFSITYADYVVDSLQNSSTIHNHLSISFSVGSPPSSNLNSWIWTLLSLRDYSL